jgi:DNA-damage-inducible protein D
MTDLELIFAMFGEASTTEIAKNKNAKGFVENNKAAKAGGV